MGGVLMPTRKPGNPNMQKGKPSVNKNGRAGKSPSRPVVGDVIGQIMHGYQVAAMQRGYVFALSEREFGELITSNCFYCGVPPSQIVRRVFGQVVYTGIDRVDNSIGYIRENCVPCCKQCNYSKRMLSVEEFLRWAERLVDHQRSLRR